MNPLNKAAKLLVLLSLSLFLFTSCHKRFELVDHKVDYYRIDKKEQLVDQNIADLIKPYKESLSKEMDVVVGYSKVHLLKEKPESTMGNLLSDVILDSAHGIVDSKVDFAIQNYGGMRINEVSIGPITKGKIFELMPFENFIVIVEVPGDAVLQFFDRIAQYGGWPVSRGVRMKMKGNQLLEVAINNERIDPEKIYHVAMPDYVANGGDKCYFFEGKKQHSSGVLVRNALIEHISSLQEKGLSVDIKKEGRIIKLDK